MSEPEVSVPAVMRNYREVLRNDFAKVDGGDVVSFATAWKNYTAAIAVHAAMEDGVEGAGGGSTAMLDHYFDGASGAPMFKEEHVQEHAMQRAVTAAIADGAVAVRTAFATYRAMAEAHLKHEEAIMMPLVARLPPPKAPLFADWCVTAGIAHGGFEHFMAHGVASLAAYGSAKNTPVVATRVFLQSFKAMCPSTQWDQYPPVARAAASPETWAGVVAEVPSLESPLWASQVQFQCRHRISCTKLQRQFCAGQNSRRRKLLRDPPIYESFSRLIVHVPLATTQSRISWVAMSVGYIGSL